MTRTYIPPHPGRYLREDLEEFGIEPRTFAKRIGVEEEDLRAVLEEKAPITQDLAERIAGNLEGPPAAMWFAMQKEFEAWQAAHAARDESSDCSPKRFPKTKTAPVSLSNRGRSS